MAESVCISNDIKVKYPNLFILLERMALKKESKSKLENVKYEKSKKEWLKYESTYQSILKTIQSHLEEILKGTFTTEECNFWKSFEKVYMASEVLSSYNESIHNVLGVTKQSLEAFISEEKKSWSKSSKEEVESSICKHLEKTCLKLTEYYDGTNYSDHKEIQIDRSRNISEVIKLDKDKLIKLLNDVKKCKQESVSYFIDILMLLNTCGTLIEKLMSKYQLNYIPKKQKVQLNLLCSQLQNIALKAKSTKYDLMSETYTKKNVEVLKEMNKKLSTQKSALEGEIREVKNKVEVYQTLGSDYESIVSEYTDTVEKLNKQKWLLQQISKRS